MQEIIVYIMAAAALTFLVGRGVVKFRKNFERNNKSSSCNKDACGC